MEKRHVMYQWPDDIAAYSGPLDGYFYVASPDIPDLYIALRRLEVGEKQTLPSGLTLVGYSMEGDRPKPEAEPLHNRATTLYRCFGSAGELLYVGIAADAERRWSYHAYRSAWWSEVTRKETELYPNRTEALRAEAAAIRSESPIYNIAGKPRKP